MNDSIISGRTSNQEIQRAARTQGSAFQDGGLGQLPTGTIDVLRPQIPDATARLRMKLNQKHVDDVSRKKQLANQLEGHRLQVLDQFHIKATL